MVVSIKYQQDEDIPTPNSPDLSVLGTKRKTRRNKQIAAPQDFGLKENPLKGKNNIIYPLLYECKEYTSDEFWKSLFEDLSTGKCPKSIYISNDTIYTSNRKRSFSYIIPKPGEAHARDVFKELRELLIQHTTICSAIDVDLKREKLSRRTGLDEIPEDCTWSEIKKKNLREILIIKFVIRMRSKYGLSWGISRHLYSLIQSSFLYKTHNSSDVVFSKRKIDSINDIIYDANQKSFVNLRLTADVNIESEDEEVTDKFLFYYWDKYLSNVCRGI